MSGKVVGTQVDSWLDFIVWPLLKLFWEPFSRKQSHWWHWRSFTGNIDQAITVSGDKTLRPRSWQHRVFWGTNFAWEQVIVLEAIYPIVYQIGFRSRDICQLCSLMLTGEVALTIGPEDTEFFGITADGQTVALQEVRRCTRRKLPKNIPLL